MRKLVIQQEETTYTGYFSSPAFALWGGGVRIIEGLYKAFTEYGISLGDIIIDPSVSDSSSQGIRVDLSGLGDYKFGFEQVEWIASDIGAADLTRIPEVLQHGEEWLRSAISDFTFKLHNINRYNHNLFIEGTSQDFLSEFSKVDIPGVGTSLGTGLIFHWELPEEGWRMNLTIDHSNLYTGGLFIEQDVLVLSDKIDYTRMIVSSRDLLRETIAKVGLEFEDDA
jgi:hypothetical protein